MTNDRPKPGYQQTEVGVIPDDWETSPLSEKARVIDSLHKTPNFCESGYPMVRVADIKPGNLRLDETLKVSDAVFEEFTRNYKPKRGDIVLSRVGSYGVSSFVETDEPFCLGQNTVVIESKVPSRFLYYALNANYIREQIEDGSYGSGYKSLSLKNIKELTVALPSTISEQEKLAQALSDVDALIAALDKAIDKKRAIKTATMQQLLTGKKRLLGFGEGKGYQQTAIGSIPEDWEAKLLPKIAWFQEGPGLRNWQFTTQGTKVINVTNLENGILNLDRTDRHITIEEFLKTYSHFAIDCGDIVMASSGNSYCKTAVVRDCDLPLVMNTSVIRFKPVNGYNYTFLFLYLKSDLFKNQIDLMITGGAQPNFGPYHLRKVFLPVPSSDEQLAIATVLSDMDAEIAALETRLAKTQSIKQGMMQQLLTGKVRFKVEVSMNAGREDD